MERGKLNDSDESVEGTLDYRRPRLVITSKPGQQQCRDSRAHVRASPWLVVLGRVRYARVLPSRWQVRCREDALIFRV